MPSQTGDSEIGAAGHAGTVSRRAFFFGSATAGAALLSGCAALTPRNGIAEAPLQNRAMITGLPGVRVWGDEVPSDLAIALRGHLGSERNGRPVAPAVARSGQARPLVNVLALSGGGAYGAFGAGVLAGWSARGGRPDFQIVTGVSAGAIIAPFAYLGPRYDRALTRIWTESNLADLVVIQGLTGILSGVSAVDTAPLAAAIAKYVTPRLLHEIAVEHGKGRLLLLGTTNLDAQRPVVWNMGAIAASGHPDALELARKIILASAAVPGLFPPVAIDVEVDGKRFEEMHVDGGVTRDVFVAPFPVAFSDFDRFYSSPPLRRIYIINNGKITPEPQVVMAQTLPIAARAISTLLKSQHMGEITLIYRRAQDAGAEFNMVSLAPEFEDAKTTFGDVVYEKRIYDAGFEFSKSGRPWVKTVLPVTTARR